MHGNHVRFHNDGRRKDDDRRRIVTKQGYGDLVVMSMETYNQLVGIAEVDSAITYSEAELAAGAKPVEARAALSELRRKHFG